MLRKAFLGDYRPTESKKDAVIVIGSYAVAALVWKQTISVWRKVLVEYKKDRIAGVHIDDTQASVAGVALDDLKYKVWKDPQHGLMVEEAKASIALDKDELGGTYTLDSFSAEAERRMNLDPSDYWEGDPIRGWGPGKPNPHPEGTPEHEQWAYEQDYTSF